MRHPKPWFRASRGAWFAQINGKQVLLAEGKAAKGKAQKVLWAILAKGKAERVAPDGVTVGDLCNLRYAWLVENRSANTAQDAKWFLKILGSTYPDLLVRDLRPLHLERVLKSRPKWGPQTNRNFLTIVRAAINWGVKHGRLEANPLGKLDMPPKQTRLACLCREDLDKVLPYVRSAEFRDLLIFLAETGCRPGEAYRIEARNVGWVADRVVLDESKTSRKTGRPRTIYLTRPAKAILFCRKSRASTLFCTSTGKAWSTSSVNCQIRAIRKRGCPIYFSAYSLRHGFATDALVTGTPAAIVGELMGHSDVTMVGRVYSHLDTKAEELAKAIKKIRSA